MALEVADYVLQKVNFGKWMEVPRERSEWEEAPNEVTTSGRAAF